MMTFQHLKIAIFPSFGHVLPHIVNCLETGLQQLQVTTHRVVATPIQTQYGFTEDVLNQLLDFKPDYCFFLGQNGYVDTDPANPARHFLDDHQLPYALFLFDFPLRPYRIVQRHNRYLKKIFVWDRGYQDILAKLGLSPTEYLPLATSPEYFHSNTTPHPSYDLSFVGGISDEAEIMDLKQKLDPNLQTMADQLIKEKLANPALNIYNHAVFFNPAYQDSLPHFYAYINHRHASYYRKQTVYHLARHLKIHIIGNRQWRSSQSDNLIVHPQVEYPDILAVYQGSKINLNLSATQLASSLNQRVFDCFGSGNFLLTDDKADLNHLFAPDGLELPSFSNKQDLLAKVEYYLDNPKARESITQQAQELILKKHTWSVRMAQALSSLTGQS